MAEAGFPPGVVNLVTGSGARGRRRDRREPGRRGHLVHRLVGDGQAHRRAGRPPAQAGRRSSSVARTASSCWPTPTSTSPTDGILWSAFGTTGQRCTAVLAGHRRASGRRAAARAPRGARPDAAPRLGARRDGRRRAAHQRRRGRQGRGVHRSRARRGRARDRRRAGERRRPRARPLLRADDLRRRQADGPDRPGGDLRPGPVGHPGRRLRRGDDGPQPDPLRAVVERSSPAT